MPHYSDGTLAHVGDFVKGKTYNRDHPVAGTIVSITPDSDACNCQVAFVELAPEIPLLQTYDQVAVFCNAQGQKLLGKVSVDYGETKAFEKVL